MASTVGNWAVLPMGLLLVLLAVSATVQADVSVVDGEVAHAYPSRAADFGGSLGDSGVMGVLQVANPLDACTEIDPPGMNGTGSIGLIKRGGTTNPCEFGRKILNAQLAGFIAAIVYDDVDEDLVTMASDIVVDIPAVFVSLSSGLELTQLVPQVARLTNDKHMQWPSYIVSFAVIISSAFLILAFVVFYRRCYMRRRAAATVVISSTQISKLPTRVAGPVSADPQTRETCCICLEEVKEGDILTVLPCRHAFHKICIEPWLLQSHRTCPICKRDPCPTEATPLLESV